MSGHCICVGNVEMLRTQPGKVFSVQTMHVSAHDAPNATRPGTCVLNRSGLHIGLPDDSAFQMRSVKAFAF